jgi:hypothetical protein
VIEATPESIELTIRSNALNSQFLDNRWIRVASMDPVTGEMQMYRDGVWEYVTGDDEKLPTTPSSIDWYSGHLKHLPLARIEATSGR